MPRTPVVLWKPSLRVPALLLLAAIMPALSAHARLVLQHQGEVNLPLLTLSGTDTAPDIACGGTTCVAVWESTREPETAVDGQPDIFFARTADGGLSWPVGNSLLYEDFALDTVNGAAPRIATDGSGNWMVCWEDENFVWYSVSGDDGITWSAPELWDARSTEVHDYDLSAANGKFLLAAYVTLTGVQGYSVIFGSTVDQGENWLRTGVVTNPSGSKLTGSGAISLGTTDGEEMLLSYFYGTGCTDYYRQAYTDDGGITWTVSVTNDFERCGLGSTSSRYPDASSTVRLPNGDWIVEAVECTKSVFGTSCKMKFGMGEDPASLSYLEFERGYSSLASPHTKANSDSGEIASTWVRNDISSGVPTPALVSSRDDGANYPVVDWIESGNTVETIPGGMAVEGPNNWMVISTREREDAPGEHLIWYSRFTERETPRVLSVQRINPLPVYSTVTAEPHYRILFSEPVTGFDASDLAPVTSSTTATFSDLSVTGGGAEYEVSLRADDNDEGRITLKLADTCDAIDEDGLSVDSAPRPTVEFMIEKTPQRLDNLVRDTDSPIQHPGGVATFSFLFVDNVVGLDVDDLAVGADGAMVNSITMGSLCGDKKTATVLVDATYVAPPATLTISLRPDVTITDEAGNATIPSSLSHTWSILPPQAEGEGEAAAIGEGEGEGSDGIQASLMEVLTGWFAANANADFRLSLAEFIFAFGNSETAFTALDANGSGLLSLPELLRQLEGPSPIHTADRDANGRIALAEMLRIIQLYNSGAYTCSNDADDTEDGYDLFIAVGPIPACRAHASDYQEGANGVISLSELLRLIQLSTFSGIVPCASEDGFCPAA